MTGHDLDHDDGMFEVPGSRLREMTDTIADLRAKLAAAEDEAKSWREDAGHWEGEYDDAVAKLSAVAQERDKWRERFGNQMSAGQEICDENARLRAALAAVRALTNRAVVREHSTGRTTVRRELYVRLADLDAALAAAEQPEPTPEQS